MPTGQRIYQMFILLLQVGKGLYNPGIPSHAELVTREMHCSDPEGFCWIAPDTCSNGMTLAFWIQYKGSDEEWSCIINSAHFPSSIDTAVQANAFGIYFVRQVPTKLFVYLTGNVTNGRNYYQTFVQVDLEPDTWYHIAMSFSHANGLRLCDGGTKVNFAISMVKMNSDTHFSNARRVSDKVVFFYTHFNYHAVIYERVEIRPGENAEMSTNLQKY